MENWNWLRSQLTPPRIRSWQTLILSSFITWFLSFLVVLSEPEIEFYSSPLTGLGWAFFSRRADLVAKYPTLETGANFSDPKYHCRSVLFPVFTKLPGRTLSRGLFTLSHPNHLHRRLTRLSEPKQSSLPPLTPATALNPNPIPHRCGL